MYRQLQMDMYRDLWDKYPQKREGSNGGNILPMSIKPKPNFLILSKLFLP
jgi:hypothetical protein